MACRWRFTVETCCHNVTWVYTQYRCAGIYCCVLTEYNTLYKYLYIHPCTTFITWLVTVIVSISRHIIQKPKRNNAHHFATESASKKEGGGNFRLTIRTYIRRMIYPYLRFHLATPLENPVTVHKISLISNILVAIIIIIIIIIFPL